MNFKITHKGKRASSTKVKQVVAEDGRVVTKLTTKQQEIFAKYHLDLDQHPNVLTLLTGTSRLLKQRGLTRDIVNKYGVGAATYRFQDDDGSWKEHECVTFPWTAKLESSSTTTTAAAAATTPTSPAPRSAVLKQLGYTIHRVKARSLVDKKQQKLDPVGGGWGWFGWHTVPENSEFVIITEGLYVFVFCNRLRNRHFFCFVFAFCFCFLDLKKKKQQQQQQNKF
jgi:hypothetical protein